MALKQMVQYSVSTKSTKQGPAVCPPPPPREREGGEAQSIWLKLYIWSPLVLLV